MKLFETSLPTTYVSFQNPRLSSCMYFHCEVEILQHVVKINHCSSIFAAISLRRTKNFMVDGIIMVIQLILLEK
ncbi:hypothetical protein Y032_0041g405 [Ancylostoma ceylanicum]|uniref:Uncharacterized protein n=1 Tax=Ancylostoma ceylanicum TaxID=53326 RepID=A0A016UHX2_9BILA|nr:hypothetical protein Y032_0041g405 [Ancylostoma ceylanicum]